MSDSSRIRQFVEGLEEALEHLESDDGAAQSIRRMARGIAGSEEVPDRARELAREVADVADTDLESAARRVLTELSAGAETSESGSAEETAPRRALVLVGNDDLRTLLGRRLSEARFEVKTLESSEGVVDILTAESFDLLVVGLMLADRDGRDVILEVSQHSDLQHLAIVAVSGAQGRLALARTECLALGADAFLEQVEIPDRLAEEADRVIGVRAGAAEAEEEAVLRRPSFADRFAARDTESGGGGVVALLALEGFRRLAEEDGPEAAEVALGEVGDRLYREVEGVSAVGRWSTTQLALLMPESTEAEAVARLLEFRNAAESDEGQDDTWSSEARMLAADFTGAVVPAGPGTEFEERMREAGRVRIGLSNAGSRVASEEEDAVNRNRILAVEDDPVTARLVIHKLRHAGFEVEHFDNGDRAAEALDQELDFDLAIFDINLPGQDGFQLIRRLRENESTRRRPIIILSGMGSDDDLVRGLEMGADDYILKPFSPTELTARVRRLMAGRVADERA